MKRSGYHLSMAAGLALAAILAAQLLLPGMGWAGYDRAAEPNPPAVDLGLAEASKATADVARQTAAATEWIYHKTSDNLHPDGNEQQFLWLMNRARSDPAQEGIWLATMDDSDVAAARGYFNVDGMVLQNEFAGYASKPPAAFDVRLYYAAKAHSDYLIAIDGQNHDNQIARIRDSGFNFSQAAGIVFSYSHHTIHGYAGFNIDWGGGTDGTQDPPGHRYAIMSVSGNYTNVGFAVVPETNAATQVGPQVIAGNLCYANSAVANHHNRFIVGTVWEDTNSNNQYDPGEGLSGVTVMPDKGAYFAVTGISGGYAIPMLTPDAYMLTFSGGDLSVVFTQAVTVGSASVLLDLEYYSALSTTPSDNGGGASGNGDGINETGGGGSGGGGGGCLINAATEEPDGILTVMATLAAAGLLAGPALRRDRVKQATCRQGLHHPYSGNPVGGARS
ncbi:MAG: hypothetical protein MUC57_17990 [Desulfobacterales bacterium]|jgi:hypothetical protein|nr:hypothetical protein [Desulfobacterales bacterium]